jgi:transposase
MAEKGLDATMIGSLHDDELLLGLEEGPAGSRPLQVAPIAGQARAENGTEASEGTPAASVATGDLSSGAWQECQAVLKRQRMEGSEHQRSNLNGLIYSWRTGCQLKELPERYGLANTISQFFGRLRKREIWPELETILQKHGYALVMGGKGRRGKKVNRDNGKRSCVLGDITKTGGNRVMSRAGPVKV